MKLNNNNNNYYALLISKRYVLIITQIKIKKKMKLCLENQKMIKINKKILKMLNKLNSQKQTLRIKNFRENLK